jgi:hypothetical protein
MVYNWRSLWKCCKETGRRLWVAKASYFESEDNQLIVDILSGLPSKVYNYEPNLLYSSTGCEVLLIKNLDVSAGLVNSATGTVVKVLYDAAKVKYLREGKHPPPYAIFVDFQDFRGFQDGENKNFPFPGQPGWVPVTRQKFTIANRDVPSTVQAMQQTKNCYRLQFPLDLAQHITAHRAQGATFKDCHVLVDLCFDNPSGKLPPDAASILYIAITCATSLEYVFAKPVFPAIWEQREKKSR